MASLRIQETCSCGATVDIDGPDSYAKYAAIEWRANHRHEPQNADQGSNRRSVALGDADDVEGPQIEPDGFPDWEHAVCRETCCAPAADAGEGE